MENNAWKVHVKGRVQGVGFRFFSEKLARQLGIKGYVKNNPDGTVEILAVTNEKVFALFLENLKTGPAMARVDDIEITRLSEVPDNYDAFRITF